MNRHSRVVLDACVLVPIQLCDTLLRVADTGIFQPIWSDAILDETRRTLANKLNLSAQKAERRVTRMRSAFPLAVVEDFQDLMRDLTNDPKDRHVLAAAIKSGSDTIVTANLRDFPPVALDEWGIRAVHPDEFLCELLGENQSMVVGCLQRQRSDYKKPAYTPSQFYGTLTKTVPIFADRASQAETQLRESALPAFEIVSDGAALAAVFPDGIVDDTSPLGAGFLWHSALLDIYTQRNLLKYLSYNPDDWGDYSEAAADLADYALAQHVRECDEAPGQIAYLLLVPDTGHAMRVFSEVELSDYRAITLVRDPAVTNRWRVWGISINHLPSASRVKFGTG